MTHQPNEKRYIDALQLIIDDYNKTKHSRLQMKPIDVNKNNAVQVYHNQKILFNKKFKKEITNIKPSKLKIGDFVRMKRKRETFEKGFLKPAWSEEIFRIKRIIDRIPYRVFELEDLNGSVIDGKLYEKEIQQIFLPSDTPIKISSSSNLFNKSKKIKIKNIDGNEKEMNLSDLDINSLLSNSYDVIKKIFKK